MRAFRLLAQRNAVNPLPRFAPGVLLAGVLFCLTSCGPSGPKLYPVRGKLTFDGVAPAGATVVLEPVGGGKERPTGVVAADGTFTLSTYPHGDGAPAGEYKPLFTWYPEDAREQTNPKSKLPDRYATAGTSPVPTVTVNAGPTELAPIELTRK